MLRLCCLCALSVSLPSSELSLADFRVDLETLPSDIEVDTTGTDFDATTDIEFDTALGLAIGGHYGFARPGRSYGLSAGASLTIANYDVSHASYSTYGLRAGIGVAYSLTDRWTLTMEPLIEYGFADLSISRGRIGEIEADGSYLWLGGDIRATFAFTDQWLLDIHAGYLTGDTDLSAKGSDADVDMEHNGPFGGIGITYRLSAAPPVLE
ncbi:MAG: hypothetical protein ACOCXA_05400 [Planctomycetota bacterium]